MPACTPDLGNRTPTLRPAPCDLALLKGAPGETSAAPRPLGTLRRVTPLTLACVLGLMRFLLRCGRVVLGLPEYKSFARRASCPPGRRAAASHPCTLARGGGLVRGAGGVAGSRRAPRRRGLGARPQPRGGAGAAPHRLALIRGKRREGGGAAGDRTPDLRNFPEK